MVVRFTKRLRTPWAALALGLAAATPALAQQDALPLQATGRLSFRTGEATWMAPDVSPDGRTILFDLLGDIYAVDAAGGAARPLLTGAAFETQPVFSPDGQWIAFLSDRSGATNLWIARADGSDARRLSSDTEPALYTSPAWSPDGRTIYVSRTVHSILAFELFAYDRAGGAGVKVTEARPTGSEKGDDKVNVLGAVASPDGRFLYYSRKAGSLWSEKPLPHWEIVRRDLSSGVEDRIVAALPGAAMRPALSHDGTKLIYASRFGADTGLRIRDLVTGEDRAFVSPIDPDTQLSGYYTDLVPRVAFLPGDKAVITAIGGKLVRIDLATAQRTEVPFSADVDLPLARNTRVSVPDETGPVKVRVIQAPRLSPDGRRVAFAALGTLYVQPLAGGRPVAVRGVRGMAYQPAWTPDGGSLVFVTWDAAEGGALWSIPAGGGTPRRLSTLPGFYSEPAVSPDGRAIAVLRANQHERLTVQSDLSPDLATDILVLPSGGGAAKLIASKAGARSLGWDGEGRRLRFRTGEGLSSVAVADGGVRGEINLRVPNSNRYFMDALPTPEDAQLSPDGTRLLVKAASQVRLMDMPPRTGRDMPRVDLPRPVSATARLTAIGADYIGWSADGRSLLWSVGSTIRTIDADEAMRLGRRAEAEARSIDAVVEVPRDVPEGTVVLRGATVVTMRGDEVIAGADVVVTGNRIAAVGPAGTLAIPPGATIRDVAGKYVVPGLVDTHAHWFELRRQILEPDHWDLLANLAYGVTSGLDVQPFTVDVFGYQDMIDAGLSLGPRAFSTGPGVFVNSAIDSKADAVGVLTRYRDFYRTRNIKSYLVGNRTQRQYMIEASAELGMMPTTEGASDLNLNLTHALDGFAGNEHNLPVSPLRDDVVTLYARSGISLSPTFVVMYGGRSPVANYIIEEDPTRDPKLARFMPQGIIESRLRERKWIPPFDRTADSFARDAVRIKRAGGLIGIGSHGLVQGIAYHWELRAYAEGGATPREVLRAATIDGATVIGRAEQIGSLEPGKYADLLVLDADPLADVGNVRRIAQVMKNGRIYDAATLDEVWPRQRKLATPWFRRDFGVRPEDGGK